jgi:hypothetical protein
MEAPLRSFFLFTQKETRIMDICPEDKNGKHKPISLVPFGEPNGKIVEVFCENCNKVLSSS